MTAQARIRTSSSKSTSTPSASAPTSTRAIDFKAVATNKLGTIYDLECAILGLFRIQNLPEEALEPFLLINCPSILFPFLRRLVADITREGGFPPLLLDPIDFSSLFVRRQQEMAGQSVVGDGGATKLKA